LPVFGAPKGQEKGNVSEEASKQTTPIQFWRRTAPRGQAFECAPVRSLEARRRPAAEEAILAHELSHLRRYDDLTAAVHMIVQVFWFYPVVWWLGLLLWPENLSAHLSDEHIDAIGRSTVAA
jgi:hypothetical protein